MAREDFNIVGRRKLRLFPPESPSTSPTISSTTPNVGLGSLLSVTTNANRSGDEISQTSNDVEIVSPPLTSAASTAYFSYGKAPIAGFDEFYYSKAADVANGETPDLDFSGVIDLMNGGNANLVMIYPDSGGNGKIPITHDKIWEGFNLLDIGDPNDPENFNPGYDPDVPSTWAIPNVQKFPVMDPADYVAAVQFFLEDDDGIKRLEDAAGKAFCFDWEKQTLGVQRLGSIFWNDTSNPKFREALIELRRQQKAICDALKAEFPDSFFGMYGGTVDIGQSELKWDGEAFVSGAAINFRWFALLDESQKDILAQNFKDALAGTEQPWDYVTKVCYDSFAPDSFQLHAERPARDSTALKPSYKKVLFDWSFGIMKSELTVPCLGIISPSNIAVFDLGTNPDNPNPLPVPWPDGKYNSSDPYEWATPTTWIEQTIDMIREADGYLIWDGLRIDQIRQFSTNYANWDDAANTNRPIPSAQPTLNKWWNLMEDLEEKYGTLTTIANEFNIPVPTNAETWFNLDRDTIRRTDFYRNAMSKDVIVDLETTLIPLIESWRTTRIVPFMIRDQIITGSPNVGSTLTIAPAVGDYDRDNVQYTWRLGTASSGVAEIIGDESTLVIPPEALGNTIICEIRYRRNNVLLQEVEAETDVILPAGSSIVDFGQWELTVQDQAIFTTEPTEEPIRIGLSAGQQTFSIGFAGSFSNDFEVQVGNKVIFTVNGVETDPTTIDSIVQNQSPTSVTINLSSTGDFATRIANGAIGEEISFTVEIPEPEPVSRITNDGGQDFLGTWELSVEDQAIFTDVPTANPISVFFVTNPAPTPTFNLIFNDSFVEDISVEVGDEVIFTVDGDVTSPTTIESINQNTAGGFDVVTIVLSNSENFKTAIVTGAIGEEISIVVETPEPVSVSRITDDVPDANGFVGIWELSVQDQAIFTDVPPADPITFTFSFGMSTFQISLVGSVLSDISVEVGDEVIFTVDGDVTSPTTIESIDHQIVNGTDVVSIVLNNISNFLGEILSGAIGEEISVVTQSPPPIIAGTLTHFPENSFSLLALEPSGWSTFTDIPFPQQANSVSNNAIIPSLFVVNIPNEDVEDTSPTIKSSIDTDSRFQFTIKDVNGDETVSQARPSLVFDTAVQFDNANLINTLMNTNNIEVTSITFT